MRGVIRSVSINSIALLNPLREGKNQLAICTAACTHRLDHNSYDINGISMIILLCSYAYTRCFTSNTETAYNRLRNWYIVRRNILILPLWYNGDIMMYPLFSFVLIQVEIFLPTSSILTTFNVIFRFKICAYASKYIFHRSATTFVRI